MQLVSPCKTRLSDIFDIRLWNTVEFSQEANSEEDERFKKELDSMKRKLLAETSKKFYEDLREEKVVEDFEQCIRIVYDEAKDSYCNCQEKRSYSTTVDFPPKSCPFAGRKDSDRDVSTCWKGCDRQKWSNGVWAREFHVQIVQN